MPALRRNTVKRHRPTATHPYNEETYSDAMARLGLPRKSTINDEIIPTFDSNEVELEVRVHSASGSTLADPYLKLSDRFHACTCPWHYLYLQALIWIFKSQVSLLEYSTNYCTLTFSLQIPMKYTVSRRRLISGT